MTIQELVTFVFMKPRNPGIEGELYIWKLVKQNLSLESLEKIAESEFNEAISAICEK